MHSHQQPGQRVSARKSRLIKSPTTRTQTRTHPQQCLEHAPLAAVGLSMTMTERTKRLRHCSGGCGPRSKTLTKRHDTFEERIRISGTSKGNTETRYHAQAGWWDGHPVKGAAATPKATPPTIRHRTKSHKSVRYKRYTRRSRTRTQLPAGAPTQSTPSSPLLHHVYSWRIEATRQETKTNKHSSTCVNDAPRAISPTRKEKQNCSPISSRRLCGGEHAAKRKMPTCGC